LQEENLVGFGLAVRLVSISFHEIRSLALVIQLELDKPSFAFAFRVHQTRFIGELIVNFDDGSRYWGVDIRRGLHGLDTAKGFTLLEFITDFREVNKDDVTERRLGKVSDTAGTNTSINLDVFVSYNVVKIKRVSTKQ
jgi:hypothetical protein